MSKDLTIATIVGARPQFIKAAPFSRLVAEREGVREILIHTGQHYDSNMSDVFFDELAIPKPDIQLEVRNDGSGDITGRMLVELDRLLPTLEADCVLVYGDTDSTLAGALAAAKRHIPVVHVEAGLRSFNRAMPEEINRVLTDHLATLLFCPTGTAVTNLANEGITRGVIKSGDLMYDATIFARDRARERSSILDTLGLTPGEFRLATVHRAENTKGKPELERVADYLRQKAEEMPLVLPLHPRTRTVADRLGVSFGAVRLIDPLGYLDMHRLLAAAHEVLTDSGGLQKEAYFHRVPCITLRSESEWVETIDAGWNRLWTSPETSRERTEITDYGDGAAAAEILDALIGRMVTTAAV
ncbi:non-hydrolyzing UDP-N-acetylglucosamine 2-epimerase [Amorphus orientalis]|uniref:UDP-GlcNAc3NAcA epimerase n=1 Tax=Amorphus orientalis TaxID=649198 RepID=A0AAE4AUY7_9HYPH|nr:UDP-N-acetylglucosamine 2-epimerase (non-hydrolyzing) [Amorphus orientalis]MDQ0316199.1 UDP-GlcNAc3NAcA epimerase [Amorphus orientalis]